MTQRLLLACWLGATLLRLPLLAAPGDLDVTFGAGGGTGTPLAGLRALLLQPDGKVVVAGGGLSRYEADGSPDLTFGSGGTATQDLFVEAILLQPDGKIVAVGETAEGFSSRFGVARYNPDGSLDPTFGVGGKVTTDFGETAYALAAVLEPDGQIVAVGLRGSLVPTFGPASLALARYNPDGTLDPSFGTGGTVTSISGRAHAAVLQPDGKLVVAGSSAGQGTWGDILLGRYQADGTLDPTFGVAGVATTTFDLRARFGSYEPVFAEAKALLLRPDGRLVAVGIVDEYVGGGSESNTPRSNFIAIAQYSPDGSADPSFGIGGKVLTAFMESGSSFFHGRRHGAAGAALSPDGKLVAAGWGPLGGLLARYDAAGGLDPTFGPGGGIHLPGFADAMAVLRQPDGKLVVGGLHVETGYSVARYLDDCPALPDTDGDGIGDACDPCTGGVPFTNARIVAKRLGLLFDERLKFSGKLGLAGPVDPSMEGLRVVVQDAFGGVVLGTSIPPGPYSHADGGWRNVNYALPSGTLMGGVFAASVKARAATVSVRLKAKELPWPISASRLPLKVTVVFDPPFGETGRCGEATFHGPAPAPRCTLNSRGDKLTCR